MRKPRNRPDRLP